VAAHQLEKDVAPAIHRRALESLGLTTQDLEAGSSPPSASPLAAPSPPPSESPKGRPKGSRAVCVLCLDADPALACVPCGHVCLCGPCARDFEDQFESHQADERRKCPICRNPVQSTMRVYL